MKSTKPLTKHEFDEWATATKETLNSIDDRLGSVEEKLGTLDTIATELKAIRENTGAMVRLYGVLDNRDQHFADKLGVDLKDIDAKFVMKARK